MKILYHHRTLGDGAEGIHISEMVHAFRELGHDVMIVSPYMSSGSEAKIVNKNKLFLWIKRTLKGPFYEIAEIFYNFFGFYNMCLAVIKFRPNFIYDRY